MPIYAYRCPDGHESERIVSYAAREDVIACAHPIPLIKIDDEDGCMHLARLVPSAPCFRINDLEHRAVISDPKDLWEGVSGMEGTDGIDQGSYSSTSEMFDFGDTPTRRGRPEQEFPIRPRQPLPVKSIRRLEAGEE